MTGIPTLFGDGILDVHIANGVARLTIGTLSGQPGQTEPKPQPSGMLIVPAVQLPIFARILAEVTRQVEQRAKEAAAQPRASAPAESATEPTPDQVAGAFRFNG
jgi:hypothetical protein